MNAAVVHAYDAPPRYGSFETPVAGEGETLLKVSAAGLHPIVRALANGTHYGSTGVLPFVPGVDGVGHTADGRRVFFGSARPLSGTFAELAVARSEMCAALPDGLEDAAAAALGNPGMSSWVALTARARFVAGESVLILGATGVAGQLSVQIARRLGAKRIVAAGRNPAALASLQKLGADAVISLEQERAALTAAFRDALAGGVDVVLDYLWGAPAEALLAAISQKGLQHKTARIRYIEIGESAGKTVSLAGATLRSAGLELMGSGFGSASMEQIYSALKEFFAEAAKSPFAIDVKTAPLRDVEQVWVAPERGTRVVFLP
ncbi:zinc-binding dehydrogenase [Edaphobacter acidisoli]|uniref:Zinc-binding dehydrogenase n=1 Tax=Edaphobacter acidisoli TaxID=2040573 RepID=A0A916RUB6_9BACT|nr:zinc-binding alcohol dehydrogenase family protein [Edaphobacter acidisoli]GGA70856.1 zinc-binding dehydrogenase [Edaphobacter acidisoli]